MGWGRRYPSILTIFAALAGLCHAPASRADRMIVYAISAPSPTQWESPRALLLSTVENSLRSGYAPNGHIMVYLEQGEHAWLTSMASARKFQTFSTTVRDGLGLSALYHDFEGELDSASASLQLFKKASKDQRLAEMDIAVDEATMKDLLAFLDLWIRRGSFRHYEGGQLASSGKGAGCADFVMWFLNRALGGRAPLAGWMRELYLPKDLLEGTSPMDLSQRREWARSAEDGRFFMIPDPELVYRWIAKRSPAEKKTAVSAADLASEKTHFSADRIRTTPFTATYPAEAPETVRKVWRSIQIR